MEIFLDSNVLLRYLADDPLAAKIVESGNTFYVNSTVVSEVIYGYMRIKTGLSPLTLKRKLPTLHVDTTPVETLLEDVVEVPIPPAKVVIETVKKYKLLPNDATIVASMRLAGLDKLATFDGDFKRVENCTPSRRLLEGEGINSQDVLLERAERRTGV